MAGRIVLAKSVLNVVPYYVMQTNTIPKGVCSAIDRGIRCFIWSGTQSKKGGGIHLVRWEQVTKEKDDGSLGIRSIEEINKALLAKLG